MSSFRDSTILVTGGTGSFGKKFIEYLLKQHQVKKVIVFSRDELKQFEMQQLPQFSDKRVRFFIGDVRDLSRLNRALSGVDHVVHAAALKQVPACEYNPLEAVKTNVDGAKNIIEASINNGVKSVLALSTDKAVNPTNLYGATKLVAEKLFVQANAYGAESGTKFACVRYGNVVGSRGSVIPLFLKQRAQGQLTITDKRMTRFWITLDQGVRFVSNSLAVMRGGEIFVPKIPSMNIMDLAAAVAPECKVNLIGIRPGEKLHESLMSDEESSHAVDCGDFYVIQPVHPYWGFESGSKGSAVPAGFVYSSDTNKDWLGVENLKDMIESSALLPS
jgi:UDP-N-acetylglucosamine 4,6-dehydratase/5-epimerase